MYKEVTAIDVFLWGRHVGKIAQDFGPYCQFQYDRDFLRSGLEIAPIKMPLNERIYRVCEFDLPKGVFMGLPGVFADSLPDSFGNALIDQWMENEGIAKECISALDRLAYVGSRAMGALCYEPKRGPYVGESSALEMRRLVDTARAAANGRFLNLPGEAALREIMRVGTSAGGAQAKAVVGWNRETGEFVSGGDDLPEGFEHWLIKFSPRGQEAVGEKEYSYYEKALACGIAMSECRLYDLDGVKHFMTRRFDRDGNKRFHTQTLCALQHLPHQAPRALHTYDMLFRTAFDLSLEYEELEQLFRRMAFNVLTREMDDHTKNFSFLMREDGKWSLAPAYDLTGYHFSAADPQFFDFTNNHALSVNGKFSAITDEDLLAVAERFGLGTAKKILKSMHEVIK